jgi:hypothetical protein
MFPDGSVFILRALAREASSPLVRCLGIQQQSFLIRSVEKTSRFRERMHTHAVLNAVTLVLKFGGRFDAFRQPQLELTARRQ